jgi:hypothetical protein
MSRCYPAALRTTTKTFSAEEFVSPLFSEDVRVEDLFVGRIECSLVAGVLSRHF